MRFDAVLSPAEIDWLPQTDLSATVCVVFDVLRATSTIITALAHGVEAIRPVATIGEAWSCHQEHPAAWLGGERHGDRIDGFHLGNSPMEYTAGGIREVITTTTNGTVALRACAGAQEVWVGALVNLEAVVRRLREVQPARVTLVCAGTNRNVALEDVIAAGGVVAAFPDAGCSDAATIAAATYQACRHDLLAALQTSENGRRLMQQGREADVAWCAQVSRFDLVGVMKEGVIRAE